ncbi:MAG: glycosyltransferase, partial [Gammaproteobacteria bacterium]
MMPFRVAVCTYNRAARLPGLISALRNQDCPIPFELLVIDNNCTDTTHRVVAELADQPGAPVKYVYEPHQGIVFARNRAIEECLEADYMAFIDDDELAEPGWLRAAYQALHDEGAECAGGRIEVPITTKARPSWLTDELLGFLGRVDYGQRPIWITSGDTPVWSGNVAYRMSLFRESGLRFDSRYNRAGQGIGGGEDATLFKTLVARAVKIRYRPDMIINHLVEPGKIRRTYFLKLHFLAGRKFGQ